MLAIVRAVLLTLSILTFIVGMVFPPLHLVSLGLLIAAGLLIALSLLDRLAQHREPLPGRGGGGRDRGGHAAGRGTGGRDGGRNGRHELSAPTSSHDPDTAGQVGPSPTRCQSGQAGQCQGPIGLGPPMPGTRGL
jgi:hypothetical protein